MEKRIGILTHSLGTNYGANLQSLSTAYYLRKHGYTPVFFNWDIYLHDVNSLMNKEQVEMHTTILARHGFEVTPSCKEDSDFRQILTHYDIHNIIVGSDAVLTIKPLIDSFRLTRKGIKWGMQADYKFPNPFWCTFIEDYSDVRLFLMSPSCQSSKYKLLDYRTKVKMKEQLKKFSFLSARDNYTKQMICDITGLDKSNVILTPDPVWNMNENVCR